MADVFVSYSRSDAERVGWLVRCLEQYGVSIWWDREIEHDASFSKVILDEIGKCSLLIVCWSEAAGKSEWVFEEATEGRKQNKYFGCLIAAGDPAFGFRGANASNLLSWKGEGDHPELLTCLHEIGTRLKKPSLQGLKQTADEARARQERDAAIVAETERVRKAREEEQAIRAAREAKNKDEITKLEKELPIWERESERRGAFFYLPWIWLAVTFAGISGVVYWMVQSGFWNIPQATDLWSFFGNQWVLGAKAFAGLVIAIVTAGIILWVKSRLEGVEEKRRNRASSEVGRIKERIRELREGPRAKQPRKKFLGLF